MLNRFLYHWIIALTFICFAVEVGLYRFAHQQAPTNSHWLHLTIVYLNDVAVLFLLLFTFSLFNRALSSKITNVIFSVVIGFSALLILTNILFVLKTGVLLDWPLISYSFINFSDVIVVILGSVDYIDLSFFLLFIVFNGFLFFLATKKSLQLKKESYLASIAVVWLALNFSLFDVVFKKPFFYKGVIITPFIYSHPFKEFDDVSAKRKIADLSSFSNKPMQAAMPSTVVIITLESLRNDLFLPESELMPFLSSIKEQGLYFSNSYTTVSHSSKALYSLFCGVFPQLIMQIEEVSQSYKNSYCLPHWFAENKYETVFIQSADADFEARDKLVKNMGFEEFISGEDLIELGASELSYFSQDDAYLVPALDNWLENKKDKPVFISLFNSNTHHIYDLVDAPCDDKFINCYQKAVAYLDAVVADLFSVIERKRGLQNSLIIVLGDHGEAFGEMGVFYHDAAPDESVVNIPLIIYGQGFKGSGFKGKALKGSDDKLRWLLDVPVTLLENFSGKKVDPEVLGKNLLDTAGHKKIVTYCWYGRSCMTVRDKDYKWVVNLKAGNVDVYPVVNGKVEESAAVASPDQSLVDEALLHGFGLRGAVKGYHKQYQK
jgi:lipoteichoic acid synthase